MLDLSKYCREYVHTETLNMVIQAFIQKYELPYMLYIDLPTLNLLKSIRVHLPTEVVAVEYAYVVAHHTFT